MNMSTDEKVRKLDEWERLARLIKLASKHLEGLDPDNSEMLNRLRIDLVFAHSTILRARSSWIMFDAMKRAGKKAEFEEAGSLLLSLGRSLSLAGKVGAIIRKNPESKLAVIALSEGLATESLLANGGREVKLAMEKSFLSANVALKEIRAYLSERLLKKEQKENSAEASPEQKKADA